MHWKRSGRPGSGLGCWPARWNPPPLFTVAAALGVRCGSCFHVIWNQEREKAGLDQTEDHDTDSAVRVAVEALRRLIRAEKGLKANIN